jgi:hypothetical protein
MTPGRKHHKTASRIAGACECPSVRLLYVCFCFVGGGGGGKEGGNWTAPAIFYTNIETCFILSAGFSGDQEALIAEDDAGHLSSTRQLGVHPLGGFRQSARHIQVCYNLHFTYIAVSVQGFRQALGQRTFRINQVVCVGMALLFPAFTGRNCVYATLSYWSHISIEST